jgi:hypothetical protein
LSLYEGNPSHTVNRVVARKLWLGQWQTRLLILNLDILALDPRISINITP